VSYCSRQRYRISMAILTRAEGGCGLGITVDVGGLLRVLERRSELIGCEAWVIKGRPDEGWAQEAL
jgi:hypothetical protein